MTPSSLLRNVENTWGKQDERKKRLRSKETTFKVLYFSTWAWHHGSPPSCLALICNEEEKRSEPKESTTQQSQLCAVWPWAICFTSLSLSCLICKVGNYYHASLIGWVTRIEGVSICKVLRTMPGCPYHPHLHPCLHLHRALPLRIPIWNQPFKGASL